MLVKQKVIGVLKKKNVKNLSTKQESVSGPPSKHGHFQPFLILPVKMVQLPTIIELHLKYGTVPGSNIDEN